jgi:hypothetical protein
MGTGVPSWEQSGQDVKLDIYLHLVTNFALLLAPENDKESSYSVHVNGMNE